MGFWSRLTRSLTEAQKYTRDAGAVTSGKPSHVVRRVKNRIVGRALRPIFKGLWK